MLKEFREFALKGNVIDMAVGIIVGVAFGAVVKSLVDNVLMPPIGILLGSVDFSDFFIVLKEGSAPGPYATLSDAQRAGAVTLNYGLFANSVVSFLIASFAVFLLVKNINRLRRQEAPPPAPETKDCPYCFVAIPVRATRCPHCTSELGG